jgi:transcriptional regulator with XRE-family HTH domain
LGSLRSPTYQALRLTVIEARQHAGLTQRQLAGRLKRHHSWIAKIEAGERHLSVYEFCQISSALSVPADVLFKQFVLRIRQLQP